MSTICHQPTNRFVIFWNKLLGRTHLHTHITVEETHHGGMGGNIRQTLSVHFKDNTEQHWYDRADPNFPEFIPEFKVSETNHLYLKIKGKWVDQGEIEWLNLNHH